MDGVPVVDASVPTSAVIADSGPCCKRKDTWVVAPLFPLQIMSPSPVIVTDTMSTVSSSCSNRNSLGVSVLFVVMYQGVERRIDYPSRRHFCLLLASKQLVRVDKDDWCLHKYAGLSCSRMSEMNAFHESQS